jgi:hypothetical protein
MPDVQTTSDVPPGPCTVEPDRRDGQPVVYAHTFAILTWLYAAGFGITAVPVAIYLLRRGTLPEFFGLFAMCGGPWSSRLSDGFFAILLSAFLIVTLATCWAAWLVWNGSQAGAVLSLVLFPTEAVSWLGFALPIAWILGVARAGVLVLAWKSLD